MPIRFAELRDVPSLVELGSRLHVLTRFKSQSFNAQKVAQSLTDVITQGKGKYACFVAESSGRVVGGLLGVMEQQIFSEGYSASVMHIDVLPEARMGGHGVKLLKAFEQWANNRKAVDICFGINSEAHADVIGQFARKMGYRKVGENFVK